MTAGYLCAIGIALVFMLYMDGSIGVMMLSFLLLMPVLSVVLTLIVRRGLQIRLVLPDSAGKQQPVEAVLEVEKALPLPLPFLRVQLTADAHFAPLNPMADPLPEPVQDGSYKARRAHQRWRRLRRTHLMPETLPLCLSMGTERVARYRITLTPRYCGLGRLELHNVTLSDHLAMFRMRLRLNCRDALLITPEIPELKASSELFRSVTTAVNAADEESDATPNFSASSMPGYEHRGYIPGDSLKRINWKLSSKRRQLMVRQDEPISQARLTVVLDFRRDERKLPDDARFAVEEQLIEVSLGFLMLCAKYGFPCELCYADEHAQWSRLAIDDAGSLPVEAITLLRGGFRPAAELAALPLMPPGTDPGAALLYLTTCADPAVPDLLEHQDTETFLLVPAQYAAEFAPGRGTAFWLVTPERTLTEAGGS